MKHFLKKVLILYFLFSPLYLQADDNSNSILVIINNEVLTKFDLAQILELEIEKEKKIKLINIFLNEKIALNEIKKSNIAPPENLINEEIKKIAKLNNMGLLDIVKLPNFEDLLNNVKNNISIKIFKETISKDSIQILDHEIENFKNEENVTSVFEKQVKFGLITLLSSSEKSESLIKKIHSEIISGKNTFTFFEEKYSNDILKRNGDYKWIAVNDSPKEFYEFLSSSKIGSLSDPFMFNGKWIIIKLFNVKNLDVTNSLIKQKLIVTKIEEFFQNWVTKQRKLNYIKIFEEKIN